MKAGHGPGRRRRLMAPEFKYNDLTTLPYWKKNIPRELPDQVVKIKACDIGFGALFKV